MLEVKQMLIEFSVTNYQSFKNKQTFSTLATKDTMLEESNLFAVKLKKYSKINVFYGANASGKTAFCNAIAFVKNFVFNSNMMLEKTPIPVIPFVFDEKSKKDVSKFEFVFIKKGIKYNYSFSCDKKAVYTECLEMYENGKPKLVFDRRNKNQYKFNSYHELESIKDKNTDNKLFLCTAATWNFEPVKPVVEFMLDDLIVLFNLSAGNDEAEMIPFIEKLQEDNLFEEYKKFCLNLLAIGDFSISDFDVTIETPELDTMPDEVKGIINALKALPLPGGQINESLKNMKLTTVHKIIGDDGTTHNEPLNFLLESLGTRALFKFAPILFDVLKNGKVLFVDEIDRSLHPLLVKYIVSMFSGKTNTSNAQLVCNTHDTNLLDLEILRRDEVWFVERKPDTRVSEIYPLTDFSPRNNENIEKGYLLGRYGAIPFIRNGGNLWEE